MSWRETILSLIDNAPIVPRAPEPFEPEPVEPVRLRTDAIVMLGIGSATAGESVERYGIGPAVCVYDDSFRRRRVLPAEQHDRIGIRSLFIGREKLLTSLWPRSNGRAGFDHHRAAEALIADQGRVGLYWPERGEQLAPEPAARGCLLIWATRFARRELLKMGDGYLALCRLRNWNPNTGGLADQDLTNIVERLCGQLLRRRRRMSNG